MQLVISRQQQDVKGMMGGHKGVSFTLSYRLELTPEETDLVQRYALSYYPLTWKSDGRGGQMPGRVLDDMIKGCSQTLTDVTTLIGNENVMKDACDSLVLLFDVCRSFGGDEVIEYPR